MALILMIITFILAIIIVNKGFRLFMQILDMDSMTYSLKIKWTAIVVVWLVLMGLLGKLFGFG